MLRDLSDAWGWIRKLVRRVDRIESGAMLENSSITKGRLRLIGAVLRLDSGALLDLIGEWRLRGPGAITGDVYSEGKWTQVGPWDFTGDGDLAGDVDLSGIFTLIGKLVAGGVRIEDGKIYVGEGASQIVIDGATGKITAGNVTVESNKITVAGGSSPATLQDSALSFGTGGKVEADTGIAGIRMVAGDAVVNAGNTASVRKGNASVIAGPLGIDINAAALRLLINAPITLTPGLIPTQSGTGLPSGALLITSGGALRRAT